MKRNKSIDVVAGLMIIYMIFTHVCQLSYNTGWPIYITSLNIFYSYMFFFFFKSGLFFHSGEEIPYIKKNFKKLMIPYIKFSLLGYIVYVIDHLIKQDICLYIIITKPLTELLVWGSFSGNMPLWFLLTLFLVKISYNWLYNMNFPTFIISIVSSLITFILQTYVVNINFRIPYTIGSYFMAMTIFSIAHGMSKYYKYLNSKKIFVVCTFVYAISLFIDFPLVDIRSNHCSGIFIPWFVFSLAACISLIYILDRVRLPYFISNIGKDSMVYYVWHWIILVIVSMLFYSLGFSDNRYLLLAMAITCVIVLPFINNVESKKIKRY